MAKSTLKAQLDDYKRQIEDIQQVNERLRESFSSNLDVYNDLIKLSSSLRSSEGAINALERERIELINDIRNSTAPITDEQRAQLKQLRYLIRGQKALHAEYKRNYEVIKKQATGIKGIANMLTAASKDVGRFVKGSMGYFYEQDEAIKSSALNMGILRSQSNGYWHNLAKTSLITNRLGIGAAQLAKMQMGYSDALGRSVILSKEGLVAMAQMAAGTGLGEEGAVELAGAMEMFGVSAENTRDRVDETNQMIHQMGLNSAKVLKNLAKNLKIAQGYNFKKGIMGVTKMTAMGEKFKVSMEDTAGFADKLMKPEGAVEMAAKLQVLGGAWANMADPFQLMYDARNDMEGLQESIIKAASGTAQFDKESGTFKISALELSRLREVAEATGLSMETLTNSALTMAKFSKIKMSIRGKVDDKLSEFIESTAQYDKDKKGYYIQMGVGEEGKKYLKDVDASIFKQMMLEKETMTDRAVDAQTFDKQWTNLINTAKTAILPLIKGFTDGLMGFIDWAHKSKAFESIYEASKVIGEAVGFVVKSLTSSWTGIAVALAGWGALKAATWFANGMIFGAGFMSVTGAGNGMGVGKGFMGMGAKMGPGMVTATGGLRSFGGGSALKGGLRAGGMGLAGMGVDALTESYAEKGSGWYTGGKVISRGLEGAAMGAFVGLPWLGAALGAGYGLYEGLTAKDAEKVDNSIQDGFISKDGKVTKIADNDNVMAYKEGGGILDAISSVSGNAALPGSGGVAGGILGSIMSSNNNTQQNVSPSTNITFAPLKIEGQLQLIGANNEKISIDVFKNNAPLMRELTQLVHQEVAKSIGSKVNPNSVKTV